MSMFDKLSSPAPKKGSAAPKKSAAAAVAIMEEPTPATTAPPKKGRAGKSSNPDYATLLTYIPEKVKKDAIRKWEDENPDTPDASDMVEHLLRSYLTL